MCHSSIENWSEMEDKEMEWIWTPSGALVRKTQMKIRSYAIFKWQLLITYFLNDVVEIRG
jgi:hypothetical protein